MATLSRAEAFSSKNLRYKSNHGPNLWSEENLQRVVDLWQLSPEDEERLRDLGRRVEDIDHFKKFNDTHGHATGDRVLKAVGERLTTLARESDVCARWGGEEFVILLSSTDLSGAAVAAERVRAALEGMQVHNDDGERVPVTASFGVATLRIDGELDALIDRADRAMYQAKTCGRNRVETACEDAVVRPDVAAA